MEEEKEFKFEEGSTIHVVQSGFNQPHHYVGVMLDETKSFLTFRDLKTNNVFRLNKTSILTIEKKEDDKQW